MWATSKITYSLITVMAQNSKPFGKIMFNYPSIKHISTYFKFRPLLPAVTVLVVECQKLYMFLTATLATDFPLRVMTKNSGLVSETSFKVGKPNLVWVTLLPLFTNRVMAILTTYKILIDSLIKIKIGWFQTTFTIRTNHIMFIIASYSEEINYKSKTI